LKKAKKREKIMKFYQADERRYVFEYKL
jgi:hypothetical protein